MLVIHDWGSALGFDWANRHREAVQGIAYMEAIVKSMSWEEWPDAATRIFEGFRSDAGNDMVLENNIVVGLEDPEYNQLTADPMLVTPGRGGTEIDMSDPDRLPGFRLCRGSPAIGAGREGDNDATADFWGGEIELVSIGAYGGQGVDCSD